MSKSKGLMFVFQHNADIDQHLKTHNPPRPVTVPLLVHAWKTLTQDTKWHYLPLLPFEQPHRTSSLLLVLFTAIVLYYAQHCKWLQRLLLIIMTLFLGIKTWQESKRWYRYMALIRHGTIVQARVIRLHTTPNTDGDDGHQQEPTYHATKLLPSRTYADVCIPAGERTRIATSIVLPNAIDMAWLHKTMQLRVIYLPGSYRVWHALLDLETDSSLLAISPNQSTTQSVRDHR